MFIEVTTGNAEAKNLTPFGRTLKIFNITKISTADTLQFRHTVFRSWRGWKRIYNDILHLGLMPTIPATITVIVGVPYP